MAQELEALPSTAAVIDELGGNQAVGALTNRQAKTVWYWRDTGAFPAHTYLTITEALRSRGKSAPSHLWSMKIPETAA